MALDNAKKTAYHRDLRFWLFEFYKFFLIFFKRIKWYDKKKINLLRKLKIIICNYYFTCLFHFGTFLDAANVLDTPNAHSVNSTAKVRLSVMLTNRRDNDAFTGTTLTGSSEHPNRPLPVSCSFFFFPSAISMRTR